MQMYTNTRRIECGEMLAFRFGANFLKFIASFRCRLPELKIVLEFHLSLLKQQLCGGLSSKMVKWGNLFHGGSRDQHSYRDELSRCMYAHSGALRKLSTS
jgi:hypothetical protein